MLPRMSAVRPVREAENRLRGWSREVPAILAEVERRVVDARVQAAAKGGDASLEYVLNEVAFSEIKRYESSRGKDGARGQIRYAS